MFVTIFSLLQLYGFLMRIVQTLSFFIPLVSFIYGHVIVVGFVTVRAIVFTCYVHVHIICTVVFSSRWYVN